MIRSLRSFSRNEGGGVVVLAALALPVALFAVGSAVDYSRATHLKTRLQDATDAATLAAARMAATASDKEVLDLATQVFRSNISDPTAKIDSLKISAGRRKLEVESSAGSPTMFMGLVGYKQIPVGAFSASEISDDTYEIALVMDNSGSMASSAGGSSKMQAAKDAAKKLVDAMMSTQHSASRTRISIVPFTLAVNVGSQYATASWMDRLGLSSIHFENFTLPAGYGGAGLSRFTLFDALNIPWAGCVETRPGDYATNDAPPDITKPDSFFVPMAAPDEPGNGGQSTYPVPQQGGGSTNWSYPNSYLNDNGPACVGGDVTSAGEYEKAQKKVCKYVNPSLHTNGGRGPNFSCNAKPLRRLTNDKSALHAAINAMAADGNTNLLEGFMWGWRTLSPNAPFGDGRPYNRPENRKIIILLTDGMNAWNEAKNHNKSVYSPMGYYTNARLGPAPKNASEARAQMDAKTLAGCTNAKAQGVTVYTVGFSTPRDPIDAAGLNLLKKCATSPQTAYVANDSAAIITVFEEIARSIGGLRLTQ